MIQFEDAVPVTEWRGAVYHIDPTGRALGNLYYTRFTLDMATAVHSVEMPYSKMHTLGELLDRGENMQNKVPPKIEELPPLAYAVVVCKTEPIITKK